MLSGVGWTGFLVVVAKDRPFQFASFDREGVAGEERGKVFGHPSCGGGEYLGHDRWRTVILTPLSFLVGSYMKMQAKQT